MISLRDYQQQVVAETHDAIAIGNRKPLIVSGTGSGKTIIAAKLLQDFVGQGLRCLFLMHLDCLVGQTSDKLESFGLAHGFIKSGWGEDRLAPVQIASIQTLPRRQWWKDCSFDVVFYDEAHKTAWSAIVARLMQEYYPNAVHIGLTATPWRLSKREGMRDKFDALVCAPIPAELIKQGHLVQPYYYSLPEADLGSIRTIQGDFDAAELAVACNDPDLVERLVSEYHRLCSGQRAIAFAVNVNHSKAIAEAFQRAGVPSAHVDGETPISKRNELYGKLQSGELLMLSGCNVFCEGFDVPNIAAAILARPTKSKALYFQQLGRALRIATGKDRALILDQAGNVRRHGFVEDLTQFQLTSGKHSDPAPAPTKECPVDAGGCGLIMRTFEMKCACCGYDFPQPEKVRQTGDLVQLFAGQKKKVAPPPNTHHWADLWEELLHTRESRGYDPHWLMFRLKELKPPLEIWKKCAEICNRKPGWAWYRWQEQQAE